MISSSAETSWAYGSSIFLVLNSKDEVSKKYRVSEREVILSLEMKRYLFLTSSTFKLYFQYQVLYLGLKILAQYHKYIEQLSWVFWFGLDKCQVPTKTALSLPLLSWTGERKYDERLEGRDKDRARPLTSYCHGQNRLNLGRKGSFIHHQSNQSWVMRTKTTS